MQVQRNINVRTVFANQPVAIREVAGNVWQVSILEYDLGCFDEERDRVAPDPSPLTPDDVLAMGSKKCKPCDRTTPLVGWRSDCLLVDQRPRIGRYLVAILKLVIEIVVAGQDDNVRR